MSGNQRPGGIALEDNPSHLRWPSGQIAHRHHVVVSSFSDFR